MTIKIIYLIWWPIKKGSICFAPGLLYFCLILFESNQILISKFRSNEFITLFCSFSLTLHSTKMKFSIKCDQISSFLWIWSYLLKKSLMENFIFCAVLVLRKAYLLTHFFQYDPLFRCKQ